MEVVVEGGWRLLLRRVEVVVEGGWRLLLREVESCC